MHVQLHSMCMCCAYLHIVGWPQQADARDHLSRQRRVQQHDHHRPCLGRRNRVQLLREWQRTVHAAGQDEVAGQLPR